MATTQGMPTTYDNAGVTTDTSRFDSAYVVSLDGMLKVAEMVLSLIVFITAVVDGRFGSDGGAWVEFTSMSALVFIFIMYMLYLFKVVYKIPGSVPRYLIEFIFFAVYTLFYFISGIVAAAWAHNDAAVGACAFFCFATMILFGADTYFHFNVWRSNTADTSTANPPMPNTGPATVTAPGANAADPAPAPVTAAYPPAVGTTTTVEMKAQY